ncbi:MAG: hypothetical protein JSW47_20595, partial [Phycisphaerales bacterium]
MTNRSLMTFILVCLSFCTLLIAEDKDKSFKKKDKGKKDELTLEKLFPEKSFFGPSARAMEFSFDGKYAAYLYRPYKERRHGSDLWIYDVAKAEARRITSVSVMSRFQESTRKVKEDRIRKAKEADKKADSKKQDTKGKKVRGKKKNRDTDKSDDETTEKRKSRREKRDGKKSRGEQDDGNKGKQKQRELAQKKRGDWVSDKDAEDDKAPRYSGIESFEWSPKANELLFVSKGDIYQWKAGKKRLTRLTRTKDSERAIAWLPDASGYMYMRGDELIRV